MDVAVRALLVAAGVGVVAVTLVSAVRTFVVPRAIPVVLSRVVFGTLRAVFNLVASRFDTYRERDRVMSGYAPVALLALPVVWLALVLGGYTLIFEGVDRSGWRESFAVSGSSLLTLGFDHPRTLVGTAISFTEAGLGIGLVALLLTYLPAMYSAFSRRETMVAMVEVRGGPAPEAAADGEHRGVWAVELLVRIHLLDRTAHLEDLWPAWEAWFIDVEESHTSLGALAFFRSPQSDRSWVTAAGVMMDTGALYSSVLDVPRAPQAELCVRAGYIALRRIADFFRIPYDPSPEPTDPISITRDEFDEACARMERYGVPLKADRDQAWRDFAGWRVNYDAVLLALCSLTMAAPAPWSSDRAGPYRRPRVLSRAPRHSDGGKGG